MLSKLSLKLGFPKRLLLALSLTVFCLTGCGDKEELYTEKKVEDLYNQAMDFLEAKSYQKAARTFAEVERQHPYSNWAVRGQLMSAYCYYQAKKYDEALEAFQLFIQLHPGHPQVSYAYYMLGLCHYEQIPIVARDQKPAEDARSDFETVIKRFPQSVYARDAQFKIDLIQDHLAAKEMTIGRYYQDQRNPIAAINRFITVIKNFQRSSHTPEALTRLVECNLALGLTKEARAAAAILGHNFPTSEWYKDSYQLLTQDEKKLSPTPSAVPAAH